MKHTRTEWILMLAIAVILGLTGGFYDNHLLMYAACLVYGYMMGCEFKENEQ